MKKLLFLILLFSSSLSAQDYWVYIRKETKIKDYKNAEQVAGMSDTGDIVEIVPCTPQYVPTKDEKKLYKIIKISGMSELDRLQLKDTIRGEVNIYGKQPILKYRRHGIDLISIDEKDALKEESKKGEFTKDEIAEDIKDKITDSPISFYTDK